MLMSIGDVDVWLRTTQELQRSLDGAAKYCPIFPGAAQAGMGLVQIIAGFVLAIFPKTDITTVITEDRLDGLVLAERGLINIVAGLVEIVPVAGTIVAIARILIAEREDREAKRAQTYIIAMVTTQQALNKEKRGHELEIEARNRELTQFEEWPRLQHEALKARIAQFEKKDMPASVKILLADIRSSADKIRQDGVEAVKFETQFMSTYINQCERQQAIHSMEQTKQLLEGEEQAIKQFKDAKKAAKEKAKLVKPPTSIVIVLADKRSGAAILQQDGSEAFQSRIQLINKYLKA